MKIPTLRSHEAMVVCWLVGLLLVLPFMTRLAVPASLVVEASMCVAAIGLFGMSIHRAVSERTLRAALLVPVVVGAGILWVSPTKDLMSVYARALTDTPGNARIVNEVRTGNRLACSADGKCLVEAGSELRVAFVWDGSPENWTGVVYDERGASREMMCNRSIYGGNLIWSRHLWGAWYYCGAT